MCQTDRSFQGTEEWEVAKGLTPSLSDEGVSVSKGPTPSYCMSDGLRCVTRRGQISLHH